MSDKNKIVNLQERTTLTPVKSEVYRCPHTKILLIEHKRVIECEQCEKIIEPFDYLWDWANKQQRIKWRIDSAKSEAQNLEEKVIELTKQKRNLQAQVNRLNKKLC